MKKKIHPDYHPIKVEMTDGSYLKQGLLGVKMVKQLNLKLIQSPTLLGLVENKN